MDNGHQTCSACAAAAAAASAPAAATAAYVFALGRIEPRFPTLSVEKELAHATGQAGAAGLTDRQALHAVLSQRPNRYLARQICWVFTVEGQETYILRPRDSADLDLLIESVRPVPRQTDVDVIVGVRGAPAGPEVCNGLTVPLVALDQCYSFDVDALIDSIPRPKDVPAERFKPAAEEVFYRIMQMADNAGATDEYRALNYLAVRYPAIYGQTALALAQNAPLTAVDVRPSRLSGPRKLVDVIFSYTNRATDVVERVFARVDVTEQFPFLVTKLSPYYQL
jgi:hypothetical protein